MRDEKRRNWLCCFIPHPSSLIPSSSSGADHIGGHFMMANTEDFFQCRNPLKCFIDTIIEQRSHPEQTSLAANGLGRFAIKGHFADGSVQLHHLENAEATPVA